MTQPVDLTQIDVEALGEVVDPVPATTVAPQSRSPHLGAPRPSYRDSNGKYRTKSLFRETYDKNLDPSLYLPVFVLHERDSDGLPSLRRLYLSHNDPGEYSFAEDILGSYRHWQVLVDLQWFQPHLAEWRRALDAKVRSEAVIELVRISKSMDEAKALQAAKWLAEGSFRLPQEKGRPSTQQVDANTKLELQVKSVLQEDAERMGLTINTVPNGNG